MSEEGALGIGGALVIAALIAFGIHERSRADELQNQLNNAQAAISDFKDRADAAADASDNLQEQMNRFDSEDWKDVVPDAKDAANEVESAKDDLQESAAEAADGA